MTISMHYIYAKFDCVGVMTTDTPPNLTSNPLKTVVMALSRCDMVRSSNARVTTGISCV
jgi:hypothetical protein